jgi:uncharacterized OB-fold protein
MIENMPLPVTDDPIDAPYWRAALRGELVVQQCAQCGARHFPPRAMCPACQSMALCWQPVSGRGTVWSCAAPQPPLLPAFAALLPYVTAVVALEENPQLRIVGAVLDAAGGRMQGVPAQAVRIGAAVRVAFLRCAEDVALPCWTLASSPQNLTEEHSS